MNSFKPAGGIYEETETKAITLPFSLLKMQKAELLELGFLHLP